MHTGTDLTDDAARWFDQLTGVPLKIALVVAGALIASALARALVNRSVNGVLVGGTKVRRRARSWTARVTRQDAELGHTAPIANVRRIQRAHTIAALLRAASTFAIVTAALLSVLHLLNVDILKLLTAAGFVGVVLGFGAQTLIRDVLAGLSMILEEQFSVGDVVEVGEVVGTVEEIRLRVTRVRDRSGTVWYLRNGDVVRVGNRTQGWSLAEVSVPIRYDQPLDEARAALLAAGRRVARGVPHNANVLSGPTCDGIESLTPEAFTLRVELRTVPTRQWEIARELRAAVRLELAAAGIILEGADAAPALGQTHQSDVPADLEPERAALIGPLLPPPLVPRRQSVLRRRPR